MKISPIIFNYIKHSAITLMNPRTCTFVLDFKENVLNNTTLYPEFQIIKEYRSSLIHNTIPLQSKNFGAGTKSSHKNSTIGRHAKIASVNERFGQLLNRIVRFYKPNTIVELGTGLGISTLYLAFGESDARVITIEGNEQLAEIASAKFGRLGLKNITLINNTFETAIPHLINDIRGNTLVFVDGNHTLEASLEYFGIFSKVTCPFKTIIFDDINWSAGMNKAWKEITKTESVMLAIDLFYMGILFQSQGLPGNLYHLRCC